LSAVAAKLPVCIGCGCDQLHACDAGCYWVRIDKVAGAGVCSECPTHVGRFDAGDRKLSTEARLELDMREVFSSHA